MTLSSPSFLKGWSRMWSVWRQIFRPTGSWSQSCGVSFPLWAAKTAAFVLNWANSARTTSCYRTSVYMYSILRVYLPKLHVNCEMTYLLWKKSVHIIIKATDTLHTWAMERLDILQTVTGWMASRLLQWMCCQHSSGKLVVKAGA